MSESHEEDRASRRTFRRLTRRTATSKFNFDEFIIKRSTMSPQHLSRDLGSSAAQGSPPEKKFSFSKIRKMNKFNSVGGSAKNAQREEEKVKVKAKIAVSLDKTTLSILGSLNVDPAKPTTGRLKSKSFAAGKRNKVVLTDEERFEFAKNLALRYTRDVHTLNAFEALQEDRARLELLRFEEADCAARHARQELLARKHNARLRRTIEDADSEDEINQSNPPNPPNPPTSPPRSPKRLTFANLSSTNQSREEMKSMSPAQAPRRRKQSSILLLKSPLQRQNSSSIRNLTVSPVSDFSEHVSSPSPINSRRQTMSLSNGRVRITSSPSPVKRKMLSPQDKSRPSFHRQMSSMTAYSSRFSIQKSSPTEVSNQESNRTEFGYYRCSLDDKSSSSDDDSFFRELDGFDKNEGKNMPSFPVQLNLHSPASEGGTSLNEDKNQGDNDDISIASFASSMMIDIDIVQSRLLQKQAIKAAAREEKKVEEDNKMRKKKADPTRCGKQYEVSFPRAQLGDSWVEKFASAMGDNVKTIDLSYNSISKLGVNALFRNLRPTLKKLALKQVNLSHSMEEIERYFSGHARCYLVDLNLSEAKLGNINCAKLCEALSHTATVTNLDLSGNMISAGGCEALGRTLEKMKLQRLSMAWNKVDGQAASLLFKALSHQNKLLALDLSWNSIGTFPIPHKSSMAGMKELCHMIARNHSIFHLNLSANKFSEEDCKRLAKVLESNHSLSGLHFDHNPHGRIDSKGFLQVVEQQVEADPDRGVGHVGSHHSPKHDAHHHHHELAYEGSTCWCCGQWVEVEFEFKQPWVDEKSPEDVYLRLSIDNWRKDKMTYEGKCRWTLTRMVPRITITYCFALGKGEWSADVFSPDQPKCLDSAAPTSTVNFLTLEAIEIDHAEIPFERHYEPSVNGHYKEANVIWPFFVEVLPMHVVHLEVNPRSSTWAEEDYGKIDWTLDTSKLFSSRKKENAVNSYWDAEQLIDRAFAADWSRLAPKLSRMRITDEDAANLKEFISKDYRRLCSLYKRNVVLHQNNTFTLTMISFEQFLSSCDIADGSVVKKRDIDRIFISTTAEKSKRGGDAGTVKREFNQQNDLERFEFMEALVRIAKLKFLDTKMEQNVADSFHVLFRDHLKFCFYIDHDEFRKEHLYTSESEQILSAHVHNLRIIFNQYALISGGSRGRLMSIQEFHSFLDDSGLIEKEALTHDEAAICFVESKFTTPDELKSNEHLTMTFISFLECTCRMAFQVDNNRQKKNKPFVYDLRDIILEAQKRTKYKGVLIDDFMTKVVIGLKESGLHHFYTTLKIMFSDEEAAIKKCANILQNYVRGWKARKLARRKKLALAQRKTIRAAALMKANSG